MLVGIPPLTIATLQLLMSSAIMLGIVLLFADPVQYVEASPQTWLAMLALAALSTAVAYLDFLSHH